MNSTRYDRNIQIPIIGIEGQKKLNNSKVLVIGAGGLGSPVLFYLATSGVGKLGIIDHDEVEESNLNRQILHNESRIGLNKAKSALQTVKSINSEIECVAFTEYLSENNYHEIFSGFDIIVSCVDGFDTRYLINRACVELNKPLILGSVRLLEGQISTLNYKDGPCYKCLYPDKQKKKTTDENKGILGAAAGVIGSLMAIETIKICIQIEPSYNSKLVLFDGKDGSLRILRTRGKQKACKCCSNKNN
ncbi:adenylyltransferase and sulfurtransferase mocs3 [Anaeramoeba flamelloides]|uniref:Adenylyltransferase and sulfurtransferase mocs3 n=1 Tax=Anaeramoeba flamelloides TaxID=1746091 RepID=A0ABQ8XVQ9_9EUKA|nr:adenylyltransferase and sulfurtransferase mocs3 [Anaeramoeba flamelloides]